MSLPGGKTVVVGISGATCSGKTTIAKQLHKLIPASRIFSQDNYFFPVEDARHVWIPELKHINWDIVTSLDMERMTREVQQHLSWQEILPPVTTSPDRESQFMDTILKLQDTQYHVVIVEGFCIFNYKPLAELCDLKYYFTLDYEECFKRRVKRVYEPPDVPGYFENCVWPEHLKQLEEVKRDVREVKFFDANSTNELEVILEDILRVVRK